MLTLSVQAGKLSTFVVVNVKNHSARLVHQTALVTFANPLLKPRVLHNSLTVRFNDFSAVVIVASERAAVNGKSPSWRN